MVYMKYLLSKTGWFPKWEPEISDVLKAASMIYEVKNIVTPNKNRYYYVIPNNYSIRHMWDMLRVFRANGVILRPHRSRKYRELLFRVPNHGQQFMQDVMRVSQDVNNVQKVLSEHGFGAPLMGSEMARCIENLKDKQY